MENNFETSIPFDMSQRVTIKRIMEEYKKNIQETLNGSKRKPPRGFPSNIVHDDIKNGLYDDCTPQKDEGLNIILIYNTINFIGMKLRKSSLMYDFKDEISLNMIRNAVIDKLAKEYFFSLLKDSDNSFEKIPINWKYISPRLKADLFYEKIRSDFIFDKTGDTVKLYQFLVKEITGIINNLIKKEKLKK